MLHLLINGAFILLGVAIGRFWAERTMKRERKRVLQAEIYKEKYIDPIFDFLHDIEGLMKAFETRLDPQSEIDEERMKLYSRKLGKVILNSPRIIRLVEETDQSLKDKVKEIIENLNSIRKNYILLFKHLNLPSGQDEEIERIRQEISDLKNQCNSLISEVESELSTKAIQG